MEKQKKWQEVDQGEKVEEVKLRGGRGEAVDEKVGRFR